MKKNILLFLLFGIHLFLVGQTKEIGTDKFPFEQVSLETDRDIYLSGETIWFTAKINIENRQDAVSQIIYLELYNTDQKSLAQKKFRIKDGNVQGAFEIPSEFLSETYFLRAYTRYNKNFPVDYFFITTIEIINSRIGLPKKVIDYKLDPVIFYSSKPLNNNRHRINFIISEETQDDINEVFLFANSKLQTKAKLLDNGWGELEYAISDSTEYSLAFIKPSKDTLFRKLDLNSINDYSIELGVQNNRQQFVTVNQPKNIKTNPNEVYTIELINSKLRTFSNLAFTFSNNSFQFSIPQEIINTNGIYFILLKNSDENIIAVHSTATINKTEITLKTSPNKSIFSQREKVSFGINMPDNTNIRNIGIKVIPKGTELSTLKKLSHYIFEPQLLLSYLKTEFNPNNLSPEELRICMQIINNQLNTKPFKNLLYSPTTKVMQWVPEIRDIGLSGTIVKRLSQEPLPNIPIYLSIFKEHPQIHIYNSRKDGSFLFSLNNFERNQHVFLCPLFNQSDELELKIHTDFSPNFPDIISPPLTVDSSSTNLLEQLLVAYQTSKVYKTGSKEQDFSISPLPYAFDNPEISIVLDDYIETPTLEIVFKELVPKIRVKKRNENYSLSIFDDERKLHYNNPLILVDNIPIFNINQLMKISPKIIEKIEMHSTPFILGDHTIYGIIMISTFTKNFGGITMPKSSTFFEYQTVSPSYNFRAKTYNSSGELKSRKSDFRTLLHWDPIITLKSDSEMSFYTSDQSGEYEIFIWGSLSTGQTFHSRLFDFQVSD